MSYQYVYCLCSPQVSQKIDCKHPTTSNRPFPHRLTVLNYLDKSSNYLRSPFGRLFSDLRQAKLNSLSCSGLWRLDCLVGLVRIQLFQQTGYLRGMILPDFMRMLTGRCVKQDCD